MTRCGWVRPRELERLVGKITNWFLLHRPSLAVFNAVYAFCHSESPETPRRLWQSVLQELEDAVAVLPLVRSDLSRPVAEQLIQTIRATIDQGSGRRSGRPGGARGRGPWRPLRGSEGEKAAQAICDTAISVSSSPFSC